MSAPRERKPRIRGYRIPLDTKEKTYSSLEYAVLAERVFRKRHRLRNRELRTIDAELKEAIGISPFGEKSVVDVAETDKWRVILDNDEVVGFYISDRLFPTIKGLLKSPPSGKYVTVDMGAISFVANGADIMTPGIVDADEKIEAGDVVWIRDERNMRPIAVGTALIPGSEMSGGEKGKAVKNIHYVGDEIWALK